MILISKVIVDGITIRCFFLIENKCLGNEEYIYTLNNVISILDLFKILTHYIDDKKILEIRNYRI